MTYTKKLKKHNGKDWKHNLVKVLALTADSRASHGPSQWRNTTPGESYEQIGHWKSAYGRKLSEKYNAPPLPPAFSQEVWDNARVNHGGRTRKYKKTKMKETILNIVKSAKKEKKYTAFVRDKKNQKN